MSAIVLKGSPTDLSVLEELTPSDLFAPDGTAPVFEAIKNEVAAFVPDITTPKGRKEISALAYKISQSKNFIDKVGKTFNADLKEKTKAVDAERKAIWDKLEALQEEIRAPLTQWEAAEEARVNQHKADIFTLERMLVTQYRDKGHLNEVARELVPLKNKNWDEFEEIGKAAWTKADEHLQAVIVKMAQEEKDRLELETLRAAKAEQDRKDAAEIMKKAADAEKIRIEREATEKAQRDAQSAIQAEKDRAAREKAEADERVRKAEEARVAAEAKAKFEADAAVEAERKRAAAEKKREDDAVLARENDRAHHAKINNEVVVGIAACCFISGLSEDDAKKICKEIVVAIALGKVPHVKILY